ncbi:MAG: DUF4328 domain-containing protein [Planctomycetes bacterium]|nr:DUF4328 domain-containing protein [Planctomycetota bacterium]
MSGPEASRAPAQGTTAPTCSGCPQLRGDGAEVRCELRGALIFEPTRAFCVSHPDLGGRRDREPLGPLLLLTERGTQVLETAPDSPRIRDALLGIVEECTSRHAEELDPRAAIALWQLLQWGERRVYVHADGILGTPQLPGAPVLPDGTVAPAAEPEGERRLPVIPRVPIHERRPAAFRRATGRARATTVLLGLGAVVSAVSIWSDQRQAELLQRFMDTGFVAEAEATANDARVELIELVDIGLFLLTAIVFLTWMYRAYSNLRALGARHLVNSPAWAVGGWFVPILNLVRPVQVMSELWRESLPADRSGSHGLLGLWWTAWLAANLVGLTNLRAFGSAQTAAEWLRMTRVDQAASAAAIVAAVLAILVVRSVDRRQGDGAGIAQVFE